MGDSTENSLTSNDPLDLELGNGTNLFIKKGNPKDTVYHYTTFTGLKGIIESKQLWLTDYQYLNDTSEVKYSLLKLLEIINTHVINNKYNISFWNYFIKNHNAMIGSGHLSLFVCSFCKKSDYLPSWRWYADDARGFAIGFNKRAFKNEFEPDTNKPQYLSSKIYYGNGLHMIDMHIKQMINYIENRMKNESINGNRIERYNYYCEKLTSHLLVFLPFIKNVAYKEEHEYRIIEQEFMNNNPRIFYRATDTKRPYANSIPTTAKNINADNICEIWVGPRNNFEHAKNEIEKMLEINDYLVNVVKIKKSQIPYRNNSTR